MTFLPVMALPAAAWLLPNHYFPWASAWQEGAALALLLIAALLLRGDAHLGFHWAAAIGVAMISIVGQWLAGHIQFGGDAVMAFMYVTTLGIAMAVGNLLPQVRVRGQLDGIDALGVGITLAAIASIGIALVQWTSALSLGIYAADLPPGGRPFGNVAQPNHLCTIAVLGICAVGWLHQSGRVGRGAATLAIGYMLGGMVMTGSRTGWVQISAMVIMMIVLRRQARHGWCTAALLVIPAAYTLMTLAWPLVNELLLLAGGRSVTEQADGGVRLQLWAALLDAVRREALWGYGWQQVTHAQQAIALDHPPINRLFEHSHNLAIDLFLWAGVPVGGLIGALGGIALLRQVKACADARGCWLMVATIAIVIHAALEVAVEYAYFLIPLGLFVGAANSLCPTGRTLQLDGVARRGLASVSFVVFLAVAYEYLIAEENHRMLRLESARIGVANIETPPPDLHLLTQLEGLLRFARTEAREGMSDGDLRWMREVSQRYPYPPAMLRFALAAGLNGDAKAARQTLLRLCAIHPTPRCNEAQLAWQAAQQHWPVLQDVPDPWATGHTSSAVGN